MLTLDTMMLDDQMSTMVGSCHDQEQHPRSSIRLVYPDNAHILLYLPNWRDDDA
jgi:hypothetical protein